MAPGELTGAVYVLHPVTSDTMFTLWSELAHLHIFTFLPIYYFLFTEALGEVFCDCAEIVPKSLNLYKVLHYSSKDGTRQKPSFSISNELFPSIDKDFNSTMLIKHATSVYILLLF